MNVIISVCILRKLWGRVLWVRACRLGDLVSSPSLDCLYSVAKLSRSFNLTVFILYV